MPFSPADFQRPQQGTGKWVPHSLLVKQPPLPEGHSGKLTRNHRPTEDSSSRIPLHMCETPEQRCFPQPVCKNKTLPSQDAQCRALMGQTLVPSDTDCHRADRSEQETLPKVTSEKHIRCVTAFTHAVFLFKIRTTKKDFVSVLCVYGSLRKYTQETQWLPLEGRSGGLEEASTLFPQTPSPCVHYKLNVKIE